MRLESGDATPSRGLRRSLALGLCVAATFAAIATASGQPAPVSPDEPAGRALVERLLQGGLVMYFRHADTTGMPCDRTYRIGHREGQRNISAEGRGQSRRIGEAMRELSIPIEEPILTGPVFRARDTAELAFGAQRVEVTDSLLADDYAGSRVRWVLSEHRRLFSQPTTPGLNRILFGHRTPGVIVMEGRVRAENFPEGAALVLRPTGEDVELLGILTLAPLPGRPGSRC